MIRTVEEKQDQFYARGTWAPSTNETLGFTFLNDPTEVSGSRDRDVTTARDSSRVQGGNNYHLKYTRLFGDLLVEGSYSRHNGEVSDYAALPGPRNSIVFRDTDIRTLEDERTSPPTARTSSRSTGRWRPDSACPTTRPATAASGSARSTASTTTRSATI